MELLSLINIGGWLILGIGVALGQEDSLRSALNAVARRQKEFSDYSTGRYDNENFNDYGPAPENFDDLNFLPKSNDDYPDYVEGRKGEEEVRKRISTAFRERLVEDKKKQVEELVQNLLANADPDNEETYVSPQGYNSNKKYASDYNRQNVVLKNDINKRTYPKLEVERNTLRKFNKFYNPSGYDLYSDFYPYPNRIESDYDIGSNFYQQDRKYSGNHRFYSDQINGPPPSKRSSYVDRYHEYPIHEYKRSTKKQAAIKTDPKVAKELSSIFGSVSTEKPQEKFINVTSKKNKNTEKNDKNHNKQNLKSEILTEKVEDISNNEPLQIKKKSVNWSDYFGLDRRKKSHDELNNEWLIERYHKALATNSKRSAEYPLNSFKNHDQSSRRITDNLNETQVKDFSSEESKISDMDSKLKVMEESVIDDAIKFTGAHEGTYDTKEIQEVKDRVISRLAAAYSLEKMRRALGEYKLSILKEKERLKHQSKNNEEDKLTERKRLSVPRKQAVDEELEKIPESDNNIRCAHEGEDCEEQNYRTSPNILQEDIFECPKFQQACNKIASILEHHKRAFEIACNMHQMCLLCNNNNWFPPTRQCNALFLTKASQLCDGEEECQREMQYAVRYSLDVNRSLRFEPLGDCELSCANSR